MGKNGTGRDFKPGQSGNPNGRPPVDPEIKQMRELNKIWFEELVNKFLNMPFIELQAFVKTKESHAPSFEHMIAMMVAKAIVAGDERKLNFLLDRIVGPVIRKVQLGGNDNQSEITVFEIPDNGRKYR